MSFYVMSTSMELQGKYFCCCFTTRYGEVSVVIHYVGETLMTPLEGIDLTVDFDVDLLVTLWYFLE